VTDGKKWKDLVRQAKEPTVCCSASGRRRRYHLTFAVQMSRSIILVFVINKRSCNSAVSTVTTLQAGCHKNCGFTASTDIETSVSKASVPALGPTQRVMGVCFPRIRWLWHELDHAPSLSAKC
jgi:hypothetical protein